ncbi:MAG: YCF48-related protein [Emcibacter sp.]|nr:YCF48-related protein [Emcibacter sp.]
MNIEFKGWNRNINLIMLAGFFMLLTGCEAKLDLSGIVSAKEKPTARYDQYQAAAKSSAAVIIIGNRGVMLTSRDNGASWTRSILPGSSSVSYPTLVDIEVCPDNHFVALDADRKLWISDVNGENWISKAIPTEEDVLDLTCDPRGGLWVVGSFTLIMGSNDGGNNWVDKSISEDAMLSRIQFIDADNAVVTGEFGSVYTSRDGGESWDGGNAITSEFYAMASHFASQQKGWVGGLQGIIYQTDDGGQNWHRQQTASNAPIYNFTVVNGHTYAIGEQGTILVLSGEEWKPVKAKLGFGYLRAAVALGADTLLVAGGGGLIRLLHDQDLKEYAQINNLE